MIDAALLSWLSAHPLSPVEVDCATAVMLKILDGKCRMNEEEKVVMAALYEAVKNLPGKQLEETCHALIAAARLDCSDTMRERVYEKRVLAETTLSRPVMKTFKARIRREGLFEAVPIVAS